MDVLIKIIPILFSTIGSGLLGYIVNMLKKQQKEREANARGTMLLLRVNLIDYHDRYTRKGHIPSYAYENFIEMYNAYHDLGGNGMITHMKQEVDELEIKKDVYEGE